jgi:hypothetical protein
MAQLPQAAAAVLSYIFVAATPCAGSRIIFPPSGCFMGGSRNIFINKREVQPNLPLSSLNHFNSLFIKNIPKRDFEQVIFASAKNNDTLDDSGKCYSWVVLRQAQLRRDLSRSPICPVSAF